MQPQIVAMLDARVLYPAPPRDFLMWLAAENLYEPRQSAAIQEEWIRNLAANRTELERVKLERTRDFMDAPMPQASVNGYEGLIHMIALPDPGDRHVLAAAIQ